MLIGISGSLSSGKEEITRYLTYQGFQFLALNEPNSTTSNQDNHTLQPEITFNSADDLLTYATANWQSNMVVMPINDHRTVESLSIRPFFLHLIVDAPSRVRYQRYLKKYSASPSRLTFEQFVDVSESFSYSLQYLTLFTNSTSSSSSGGGGGGSSGGAGSAHHTPTIRIINTTTTIKDLYVQLSKLDIQNQQRLRPNWDTYFMKLANLAALRSNCMKRRVGCVIAKDNRVIATGYNGTPRHLQNCNQGGCRRCNGHSSANFGSGSSSGTASTQRSDRSKSSSLSLSLSSSSSLSNNKLSTRGTLPNSTKATSTNVSDDDDDDINITGATISDGQVSAATAAATAGASGAALSTCLCLHAEENALLESGRERINNHGSHCILYCNTCPCLTCSIKIIQLGITEVVYSQSYSMDGESKRVLNLAGVTLRQFEPPKEVLIS